jgi:outer membrane protein OmpA-like peptidoglycan-associated protein
MRKTLLVLVATLGFPSLASAGDTPAPKANAPPRGLGELRFAFDSSEVKTSDRPDIENGLDWLANHASGYLVIEGHTDAIGTYAYNAGLGVRRAEAVRAALVELGADPARLVVTVYGEAMPVSTSYAANRRVVLRGTHDSLDAIVAATLVRGMAVVWEYHPTGTATARNQSALRKFMAG